MYIFTMLAILLIVFIIAKIIQLHFFGDYVRQFIKDRYEEVSIDLGNCETVEDIQALPKLQFDIDKTYDNQLWSFPWNYNFKDMVVFEKKYPARAD